MAKRAISLAGGGPAAGLELGALKCLHDHGLEFDVWALACIGVWVGGVYNTFDPAEAPDRTYDYFKENIVYYAGPAKKPDGMPSGSFGPTTAQRMDPYVPIFQAVGGSMVSLAKGNRSQQVVDACKQHGGFYLGSIGGPAARLAQDCIKSVEVLEFPELGMEAVWKIEVEDFPAFIVVDDKGNDFYAEVTTPVKLR